MKSLPQIPQRTQILSDINLTLQLTHYAENRKIHFINAQIDGTRKTLEVDFVAVKSTGETEYYQVALYALEPETLRRELASLRAIPDNHPKFLLSTDPGNGSQDGIIRKNVFDWLLE